MANFITKSPKIGGLWTIFALVMISGVASFYLDNSIVDDTVLPTKDSLIVMGNDIRLVAHQMATKFAIKNKSVSQVFQLIVTHVDQIVAEIRRANTATFKLMAKHFQTELSGIQIKLDDDLNQFSPEDSLKHIAEEMAAKLVKLNTTNQKWITKLNGENRTTIASQFELVQVELDSMAEAVVNYTVDYTLKYSQVKATLLVYQKEIDSIEIRINDLLYKYNLQVTLLDSDKEQEISEDNLLLNQNYDKDTLKLKEEEEEEGKEEIFFKTT